MKKKNKTERGLTLRGPGLILALLGLAGCGPSFQPPTGPILATVPVGRVSWAGKMPVLYLAGSPYDIGYQHGSLMRRQVQESVKNILAHADRQLGIPGLGRLIARRLLDRSWAQMKPFVPDRYLEEIKGLADGARIPLKKLQRVHAIPELTSVSCASFASADSATSDGRLLHLRNLDWAIQSDVQRYSALFVCRPKGERAFVSVGWLGFIGVISGVNDRSISVAEIGAETDDQHLRGIPMPFLLRRILEECDDLPQAVEVVRAGPRTVGYNYLFACAEKRTAVVLETNRSRCAEFWLNKEKENNWTLQVPDVILRSDWAIDPDVRNRQRACKGKPDQPGLESPLGSGAYDIRYRGLGLLLKRFHGRLDEETAMAIAAAVAAKSNIQSIVYAWPRLWIATARGRTPAAEAGYFSMDLERMFSSTTKEAT